MSFSYLPALLTSVFAALSSCLHIRSAERLPLLLCGLLFASERRTVTAWFRAGGLAAAFRPGYVTVCAVGQEGDALAVVLQSTVRPLRNPARLLLGIDDTPTARYGPCVEGAGLHHNPTPGSAGKKHVSGHIWVVRAALGQHRDWGTLALPLQAQLYIRAVAVPQLSPERPRPFRTKWERAVEQLRWRKPLVSGPFQALWAAVDGGYAQRPLLRPARQDGWVVCSRWRKDAALWHLPATVRQPGQRGPLPTYGKQRLCLAKRAGQQRGWQQVECSQYGDRVTKTIKTFLATDRPAGGVLRVVLVNEDHGGIPFFSLDPQATAVEILEAMAERGALEPINKDVKEVWGAGEQQVRNLGRSNIRCFNLNRWRYSLVETWAWNRSAEELVDRSGSPWDNQPRRPSQRDKRKALQREVLRAAIEAVLSQQPTQAESRMLAERLLDLAIEEARCPEKQPEINHLHSPLLGLPHPIRAKYR